MNNLDKIPSYDIKTEQVILGSILINNEIIGDVIAKLPDNAFYDITNRLIFQEIKRQYEEGKKSISPATLNSTFSQLPENDEKRVNVQFLFSITNHTENRDEVFDMCEIILEHYKKRKLAWFFDDMQKHIFQRDLTSSQIAEHLILAEKEIEEIGNNSKKDCSFDSILKQFEIDMDKEINVLDSFYPKLDSLIMGFQAGEVCVLGARPSIGKTAFCLNLILNQVLRNHKVGFFSCEMNNNSIIQRLVSAMNDSGINVHQAMRKHEYKYSETEYKPEYKIVKNQLEKMEGLQLFIDDTPNAELNHIKTYARDFVKNKGAEILYIDYIGLVKDEQKQNEQNHEKINRISKDLKQLARELEVPIVVLVQLNRDAEGTEPKLDNLRGSGGIEEDADVILFLHGNRTETDSNLESKQELERIVIIEKNRQGTTGRVAFNFNKTKQVFTEK